MSAIVATAFVQQMAAVRVIIRTFGTAIMKGREFYPIDNLRLVKIINCNVRGREKSCNLITFQFHKQLGRSRLAVQISLPVPSGVYQDQRKKNAPGFKQQWTSCPSGISALWHTSFIIMFNYSRQKFIMVGKI
jgi:hypothetical protein